ncbi:MAG TPA: hypothetical protein VK168_01850 [Saprospiraceae bacterium]|nr:hypothetical protein [Saprospiraceae bacterium]
MKQTVKMHNSNAWKAPLFTLLLFFGAQGFSVPSTVRKYQSCIIENLQHTAGQGSVTYNWNAVSGANNYKTYYVRLSDGYTSETFTVYSNYKPFYGLTSGAYRFYFAADCGSGTLEYIADEVIL